MSEFFGNLRGATDKRPEVEAGQEGAKKEIGPNTLMWHVIGSERYHFDKQCPTLDREENPESKPKQYAIGRFFGEMNALNRMVQNSSIKLNETGKLELCPDCDKKKIKTVPKDSYAIR